MNDLIRIAQLRTELEDANVKYYVQDSPTLTDSEFDRLLRELINLEAAHPEAFDPNSPTQRVGSKVIDGFVKTKHEVPMLSLDNTFTPAEVIKFFSSALKDNADARKSLLVLEAKFDGLSLGVKYVDGKMVQAVTRGQDGIGDDVTANARTIRTLPLTLSKPVSLEVRGEAYMPNDAFEKLNEQLKADGVKQFSNPRNAASGSMKLLDSAEVAGRGLKFVAYQIVGAELDAKDHVGMLKFLADLGFSTSLEYDLQLVAVEEDAIKAALEELDEARQSFDVGTDGGVFKINSLAAQRELGLKTKTPRWGVAFKYPPEQKAATLKEIFVSVGRTGQQTPQAVITPVNLGGANITAANLMNADEVERLGVNVGDEVMVLRSAEVIPRVKSLKTKHSVGAWKMPAACPSCGSTIERNGVHWFCTNHEACPAQVFERIFHACCKSALDLDGGGEALVSSLIAHGVKKISDIFTIDPTFLSGATRTKFLAERERVKSAPLWRKLNALGIEDVGKTHSQTLAMKFGSIVAIADAVAEGKLSKLIGPVCAENVKNYLMENAEEIERLDDLGLKFEDVRTGNKPAAGKVFVITGSMTSGTRDQVSARIIEAGGMVKGSVGKAVDYLVVGEGGGANKAKDAEKRGTKCIGEAELYAMLQIPMPVSVDTSTREF